MVGKREEGRLREGGGKTVRESGGDEYRGIETGRETPGDRERKKKRRKNSTDRAVQRGERTGSRRQKPGEAGMTGSQE